MMTMLMLFLDVYHKEAFYLWGISINGLTLWSTELPPGPDTIWLGNIPFALTLAMLSHALQIMGAMYYLCFKTFEGTEGCILPQSKCEITKHVTTGSAKDWANGSGSWWGEGGAKLDVRQASHDQCQSKPLNDSHWVWPQLYIPAAHP